MTMEELQKKYDHLVYNVTKMRHHQRLYLQFHSSDDLNKAKRYQGIVDDLIIKEVKEKKSNQIKLL